MQASRRVLNKAVTTPRWHSFFHKNNEWSTPCTCANRGILWFTDSVFCLTQRWSTARSEAMQVWTKVRQFNLTVGDLWKAGSMTIQMYLIFHAGTVLGRGSFQGYRFGPTIDETWPDKNAPKGH
mmetsp:Transcript_38720/g.83071  ORF Transcript_38720/g.83071 Transcript_38720/m.83071 type:complete len:124 (+) Transcript_38720:55-426(+)